MKLQSDVKEGGGGKLQARSFTIKCRKLLFYQVQFNCVLQKVRQNKQATKCSHIVGQTLSQANTINTNIYSIYIPYIYIWILGNQAVLNY